jgi:hypothetical protein
MQPLMQYVGLDTDRNIVDIVDKPPLLRATRSLRSTGSSWTLSARALYATEDSGLWLQLCLSWPSLGIKVRTAVFEVVKPRTVHARTRATNRKYMHCSNVPMTTPTAAWAHPPTVSEATAVTVPNMLSMVQDALVQDSNAPCSVLRSVIRGHIGETKHRSKRIRRLTTPQFMQFSVLQRIDMIHAEMEEITERTATLQALVNAHEGHDEASDSMKLPETAWSVLK